MKSAQIGTTFSKSNEKNHTLDANLEFFTKTEYIKENTFIFRSLNVQLKKFSL